MEILSAIDFFRDEIIEVPPLGAWDKEKHGGQGIIPGDRP